MSYAVQPARSVDLKNGDCRYQGPKYSVALFVSISSRSFTIVGYLLRVRPDTAPGRPQVLNHDSRRTPSASAALERTPGTVLNTRSGPFRARNRRPGRADRNPSTRPGSAWTGRRK